MKSLSFLLTPLLFFSQSCSSVENLSADRAPACRVLLAPPLQVPGQDAPSRADRLRIFLEQSTLSAEGHGSRYHLFWSTQEGLYHATRDLTGAPKDSPWLSVSRYPGSSASLSGERWDVEPYLGKFLLAAPSLKTPGAPLTLVSGVESPFLTRKYIYLPQQGEVQGVDLAIQGQTAAVVFSQRSSLSGQDEVYVQLVDLCVLSEDASADCSAELTPHGWVGETLPEGDNLAAFAPPDPTEWTLSSGLSGPRLLGTGSHPAVVGFEADAFLVTFALPGGGWKVVRVPLAREELAGPLAEVTVSAEEGDTRAPLSLVRVLAQVFSFPPAKGGDALQLSRVVWRVSSEQTSLSLEPARVIPLGRPERFVRYASILDYHITTPRQGNEDGFAALWLGKGLLSSEGLEMHFALITKEGKSKDEPLWMLPGEKIQDAVMAGPYRDERALRFGVFYQHERPDVGLGFTQVVCE